jgi:hypothetical protein
MPNPARDRSKSGNSSVWNRNRMQLGYGDLDVVVAGDIF